MGAEVTSSGLAMVGEFALEMNQVHWQCCNNAANVAA
jgi:hypothetical protein